MGLSEVRAQKDLEMRHVWSIKKKKKEEQREEEQREEGQREEKEEEEEEEEEKSVQLVSKEGETGRKIFRLLSPRL